MFDIFIEESHPLWFLKYLRLKTSHDLTYSYRFVLPIIKLKYNFYPTTFMEINLAITQLIGNKIAITCKNKVCFFTSLPRKCNFLPFLITFSRKMQSLVSIQLKFSYKYLFALSSDLDSTPIRLPHIEINRNNSAFILKSNVSRSQPNYAQSFNNPISKNQQKLNFQNSKQQLNHTKNKAQRD